MKRTRPSYSRYALAIALLVHLLIGTLLLLLSVYAPPPPSPEKPSGEERFRLSLRENPSAAKEALVPNTLPPRRETLSVPRGEQMIRPAQPQRPSTPAAAAPEPAPEPARTEPLPEPTKAFVRHTARAVATIERRSEKGLYDILSQADSSVQVQTSKSSTRLTDSIDKLYGDKFNELSEGEQKYILDNQEMMRRITQAVLDRYGRSRIPDSIRTNDTNMIEFYLHPDGSISDIRFLKNSRLSILDDTTREVIELAYAKYPRPPQKTLIRYRVSYNLGGY